MGTYLSMTLVACTLAAAGASARQGESEDAALRRVQARVDEYVVLRRDATHRLPAPAISSDARTIVRAVDMAADAIRAVRPDAKAGDIFDARAGDVLRARIRNELRAQNHDPAEILAFMLEYDGGPPLAPPPPAVNGRVSWTWPSFMVPCLFGVLPALPPELEYRFVERDLILIDVDANLVVDILEDAFPATASR